MRSRFDAAIERRGTGSLKWDGMRKRFGVEGDDLLPMWVADMEFRPPEAVVEALVRRANQGLFGYAVPPPAYFAAIGEWMRRRHGWEVKEEWIASTPGVVCAVNLLIRALTDRGDGVVIQPPVYHPFRRGIEDNGCRVLSNPLLLDGDRYRMDLDDLERKLPDAKLLILCSPHNPVGRVWTAEELRAVGDLCLRHGVIVVSDEIHFDLVFPSHAHTVFATLSDDLAQQSIVCTAASKTFNLPGLQSAMTVIPNPRIRRDFAHMLRACGIPESNVFCLDAVAAAYTHGEDWLVELLAYLEGNVDALFRFVETEIPQIRVVRPEGTFLAWLDCRALGLEPGRLEQLLLSKGRLVLNQGYTFGPGGEGFVRLNLGCPRRMLEDGLTQLARAVRSL
ncbi:MAG: cystathionine beta-lyase [candidate division NC10 bacterium RBG_16_65_8]|nr:MAG: cystathionine beta-lyase [candidate division NC10 bacterium RBG_16_65_8]